MTSNSRSIFAQNLTKYVQNSGRMQKDIAAEIGVSTAVFSDWCNGKKYPRIDKVEKLAKYFNISKSDLIENQLTFEQAGQNDLIAAVVIRMRTDADFFQFVEMLHKMDAAKVAGVKAMLDALTK